MACFRNVSILQNYTNSHASLDSPDQSLMVLQRFTIWLGESIFIGFNFINIDRKTLMSKLVCMLDVFCMSHLVRKVFGSC